MTDPTTRPLTPDEAEVWHEWQRLVSAKRTYLRQLRHLAWGNSTATLIKRKRTADLLADVLIRMGELEGRTS